MRPMVFRLFFILVLFAGTQCFSQANALEISAEKEKAFTPYMLYRHGGAEGLAEFKKTKPHEYLKELWYYSSSFYIKRDHFDKGWELDASIFDITRYEKLRKEDTEAIIVLDGYKDVLVLLPAKQLLYKP